MNSSKQKYKTKYRNKRFKTQAGFERWLNKERRYIITFRDKGQDCLEWVIDEGGEVLHANLQSSVWNGMLVDLDSVKVGKNIGVLCAPREMATKYYDFVVSSITDTDEL